MPLLGRKSGRTLAVLLSTTKNGEMQTPLERRPKLKPHFRADVIPGSGVFLLSETQQTVLQGRLYETIVPLLDGRTVQQVCDALQGHVTLARVFYTLKKLEQKGCLCEADGDSWSENTAYWTVQGLDPAVVAQRMAETKVSVTAMGVDPAPFQSLLQSMQVQLAQPERLAVVLADHYLREELEVFNRESLAAGRPWLLMKPMGSLVWIGPLFVPGKTGCWQCLVRRIRSNYPVLGYLENVRGEGGLPEIGCGQTAATQSVALGLAANAVAAWVAYGGEFSLLEGKIQTFDTIAWKTQTHNLIRQPSCPACGDSDKQTSRAGEPLVLKTCKKNYTEDGGHRVMSPEATLQRCDHLVSPISGAVTMLEPCCLHDNDVMHVYLSGNNVARGPRNIMNLRTDLRSSSCGKGINRSQAKVSALCEGLERYCGIFHGDEPRRAARFDELGEAAIEPNACMLFSDKQYEQREAQQCGAPVFHSVPRRFDPVEVIDWTPIWSLSAETVRYLPTAFCYFDYAPSGQLDICVGCSNGNAAGNTLEEAVLQGFFELAERDSVSLWWYNRVRMPGVDLESFNEPYLGRLTEFLAKHKRELWALDLTGDLGIPSFVAVSRCTEGETERIMFGFGAHLDPRIALLRAVTELNQMLVPLLQAPPENPTGKLTDPETVDWLRTATIAEHPYLVPRDGPAVSASSYEEVCNDDIKDDILLCKGRVEQLGFELLVLDQSRAEIGMPVVKVIVPGLRHFWARFAPGRLYDVPVKLGWIDGPNTEEQLNPIAMFL